MPNQLLYGLNTLEDVRKRTITEAGVQLVRTAFEEFHRYYTERTNQLINTLYVVDDSFNTAPVQRWRLPTVVNMQPVDELGKADPIRLGRYQDIGLPLRSVELATGLTWPASLAATVEYYNEWLDLVTLADVRHIKTMAAKALFYNLGWTFNSIDTPNVPATINVVPLANGDSQVYQLRNGSVDIAQHYTAQAAQVSSSADPFPTIYNTMTRYAGVSSSRPRIVSFVNGAGLISGISSLPDFVPTFNARFIQQPITAETLSSAINNELYFGDRVLGEHTSGVTIVQWGDLPDNYILTLNMDEKPLGFRQPAESVMQGLLFNKSFLSHYGNEEHDRARRIAGTGVINRTAGHIHFVNAGDTTYDVPAGFTPVV